MENVKMANKTVVSSSEDHGSKSPVQTKDKFTYGWGKFRPRSLQFLNSPNGLIFIFCIYNMLQGIAAWGLPNLVLPSIERRFAFSAKELGIIAASNDVTALLVVVFISYYGDYMNKIKLIAGGAAVTGVGILLFALPHFMIGQYHPGSSYSGGLCNHNNGTLAQCSENNNGGEWYYIAVFIFAMLVMGGGTTPFFCLFTVYLDENVEPKSFPIYFGICNIIQFISPGIGYSIGGKLLSIYVDINQPAGFNLTPRDSRWIGAWWLGFLIFGFLLIFCSFAMFGFPRALPGARERRLQHIREGNIKPSNNVQQPSLKKIPFELKELLKNWTYLFNALALTCLLLYAGGLITFFTKILRIKFGLDGVEAGYIVAISSISGTVLGNVAGSIIVGMFSLKTMRKKAAAFCVMSNLLAIGGVFMFMIPSCANTNLAGVSVVYNSSHENGSQFGLLKSQCNINCGCSLKSLAPVCGSNNVTYLDACHAGCTTRLDYKTFANCSCLDGNSHEGGIVRSGYCDRQCKNIIAFSVVAIIASAVRFSASVPSRTVMLRSVPDNKRAFASGVLYLSMKIFGLLPAPVIFGHIVDDSCRLWQNTCGRRGRCFDYDITSLSRNITLYGFTISVSTTFFYFLSWYFCVSEKDDSVVVCIENKGAMDKQAEETRF